jgi:hypothetical protein
VVRVAAACAAVILSLAPAPAGQPEAAGNSTTAAGATDVTKWSIEEFAARIRERSSLPARERAQRRTDLEPAAWTSSRATRFDRSGTFSEWTGAWYPTLGTMAQATQPGSAAATAPAASDGGESETDLAKKTQNPVADLISIPFQNNTGFGAGANYSLRLRPAGILDLFRRQPLQALRDVTLNSSDDNSSRTS